MTTPMPDDISTIQIRKALAELVLPEGVVELHIVDGTLNVVRMVFDGEHQPVIRGGHPVFEASSYQLEEEVF